jgi:aarF domain-containing kinase
VLVTEWVEGTKLGACGPEEIRELIPAAQEVFLVQMLQAGFMHADPHPGNFHRIANPTPGGPRLALLDFGLVARLKQGDMDTMISAVIHLANRDYPSLVNDFINLNILPADCDRPKVIPLMDKALTPYVKGGGAVKYEAELRKTYGLDGSVRGSAGGFAAMTQDALTVLNDIPFSIPPYFALLGRAIVTLEAYPFVARKLLREDRPAIQKALMEVLYSGAGASGGSGSMSASRLIALLDNALSSDNPSLAQSRAAGGGALIDLDGGFGTSSGSGSVREQNDGEVLAKRVSSPGKSLRLLLGPSGKSLRALLLGKRLYILFYYIIFHFQILTVPTFSPPPSPRRGSRRARFASPAKY